MVLDKKKDIDFWREKFDELFEKAGNPRGLASKLSSYNSELSTPSAVWIIKNVKSGVAGLENTKMVTKAFEQYLKDAKSSSGKILKRQKLVKK